MHTQEGSTGYKIQGQAVKEFALEPNSEFNAPKALISCVYELLRPVTPPSDPKEEDLSGRQHQKHTARLAHCRRGLCQRSDCAVVRFPIGEVRGVVDCAEAPLQFEKIGSVDHAERKSHACQSVQNSL